jgi:hypothetical protein
MLPRQSSPDPTKSPDVWFDDCTPHSFVSFDAIRTFGVPAFVRMPTESGGTATTREFDKTYSKFSPRANLRLFLGLIPNVKGFRFIDPINSKIITSRDATFVEKQDPNTVDQNMKQFLDAVQHKPHSASLAIMPYHALSTVLKALEEPRTIYEARKRVDASEWDSAIKDEYDSLIKNKTWNMARLPPGRKAIGSRWVFKMKFKADGSIERYKARLVAQGYTQKYGIDYNETFAPVVRYGSVRIIFAMAAMRNLPINQFDVNTAYLNSDLKEVIYMKLPPGYEHLFVDDEGNELVCYLLKSLYGLKQSAFEWYDTIDTILEKEGYLRIESDHSVYVHKTKDSILAIYVDDVIAIGTENIAEIKSVLDDKFGIKDLGIATYILGIEVDYGDNGKVTLRQTKYAKDILERFKMQDCKTAPTPMEYDSTIEYEKEELTSEPYRELVGSLQYLVQGTRPDLAYSVGVLSRKLQSPSRKDWERGKRILRYIKGTLQYGVHYSAEKPQTPLAIYSDADYAGNVETRISTTGYISIMAGGPITWKSQLQKTVAKSTMEAEYMALSDSVSETIWLRRILSELKPDMHRNDIPTTVYCDNQSAIRFAKHPVQHQRSKHIDVRYHFARQYQKDGAVEVKYLPTTEMVADPLTKATNKDKLQILVKLLE